MPEASADLDEELVEARARLFSLLLMRLRHLHEHRSMPSSYYIGQEYIEDPNRVRCAITMVLLFPGQVDPFEFWLHGTKVSGEQHGNALLISAEREISSALWDDLRLKAIGQNFIVGYITSLMPTINRKLLDNRYGQGHLLSRTFAVFEAVEISVTVAGRRIWIDWPPSLPSFLPTKQLSGIKTPLYVRDYIDSISAYFRHEYEDCVRRVITATENFWMSESGEEVQVGGHASSKV